MKRSSNKVDQTSDLVLVFGTIEPDPGWISVVQVIVAFLIAMQDSGRAQGQVGARDRVVNDVSRVDIGHWTGDVGAPFGRITVLMPLAVIVSLASCKKYLF